MPIPLSEWYLLKLARWISSAQIATHMILLARTTPLEEVRKPSEGLSLFFIPFDQKQAGLDLKRIKKMGNTMFIAMCEGSCTDRNTRGARH